MPYIIDPPRRRPDVESPRSPLIEPISNPMPGQWICCRCFYGRDITREMNVGISCAGCGHHGIGACDYCGYNDPEQEARVFQEESNRDAYQMAQRRVNAAGPRVREYYDADAVDLPPNVTGRNDRGVFVDSNVRHVVQPPTSAPNPVVATQRRHAGDRHHTFNPHNTYGSSSSNSRSRTMTRVVRNGTAYPTREDNHCWTCCQCGDRGNHVYLRDYINQDAQYCRRCQHGMCHNSHPRPRYPDGECDFPRSLVHQYYYN